MPRRARKYCDSGYYHVVARGINKQILFEDEEDFERFLYLLRRYRDEENFTIIAYCLMENHIHLLLHTDSNLPRIMKKISVSYAYYFNEKYARNGHLFQDRYTSEPIQDDKYLFAVVRYIHNNPQKAGICPREEYPWSSWHEYITNADLVSTKLILEMCGNITGFLEFSASNEEIECIDVSDKKRLTDKDAQEIIKTELHFDSGTQIQELSRAERDEALSKLKEKGLTVRQIERLTGINRGVVLKA